MASSGESPCGLCKFPSQLRFKLRDWRQKPTSPEIHVHWCGSCDFGQIHPLPSLETLGKSYEVADYYTHRKAEAPTRSRSFLNRLMIRIAFCIDRGQVLGPHWLKKHYPLNQKLNIFEIGTGNGHLLLELSRLGHPTTGLEPDPAALAFCRSQGLNVYAGSAESIPVELQNKSFDLIYMKHVLEHTRHPLEALLNLKSILSQQGTFVIEVPNAACLGFLVSRECWFHMDVPRHVYFFSERSLRILAKQAGLLVKRVEYVGFTRQFYESWIKQERTICRSLKKHDRSYLGDLLTPWIVLLASFFAPKRLKYDSVRLLITHPMPGHHKTSSAKRNPSHT